MFVSAWSEPGSNWAPVDQSLPDDLLRVTYDRAGVGASPPRPDWDAPKPYSAFAAELAGVMDALGIDEPAVLAGHSFGSLIVQAFTARWPGRIAGLVHVDGSVPRLALLAGDEDDFGCDGEHPQATRIDMPAGAAELAAAAAAPRVPAVVLSKTPGKWPSAEYMAEIDAIWTRHQVQLAASLGAVRIVAADAGHRLHEETPDLVAYAIGRVVAAVQTQTPLAVDELAVERLGGRLESPG